MQSWRRRSWKLCFWAFSVLGAIIWTTDLHDGNVLGVSDLCFHVHLNSCSPRCLIAVRGGTVGGLDERRGPDKVLRFGLPRRECAIAMGDDRGLKLTHQFLLFASRSEFRRIGGSKPQSILDVRRICA